MKTMIIILMLLLSGCSSTRHFVIGIGYTEFDNNKIETRMIGTDFLTSNGEYTWGFGYHNNVIITHKLMEKQNEKDNNK